MDHTKISSKAFKILHGLPYVIGVITIVFVAWSVCKINLTGHPNVLGIFGWHVAIVHLAPAGENNTGESDPFSGLRLLYVDNDTYSNVDHAQVWNLFENTRDSLAQDNQFVGGLPTGSIEKVEQEDSVALTLRYNLDCQCPKQYEVILFSVDLTGSVPSIGEVTTYKETFPEAHQRKQSLEEGGDKFARTD